MSTQTKPEATLGQGADDDRFWMIHTYPCVRPVPLGTVALCGHRRRTTVPIEDIPPHQRVRCVVCAELSGRA